MALCWVEVGPELQRYFYADGLVAASSSFLALGRAVLEECWLRSDDEVSMAVISMMILWLAELAESELALLAGGLLSLQEYHEGCCPLQGRLWDPPWLWRAAARGHRGRNLTGLGLEWCAHPQISIAFANLHLDRS